MFTSRCIAPRACASTNPDRAGRQAIIGGAIFVFWNSAVANRCVRDTVISIRAYDRSHDARHPHPNRQSTAYRRVPVRRELARAHRRDGSRCVCLRDRARRLEATDAWPFRHAAGSADDGIGSQVGQDEHVGRPTARYRWKWCRIQAVGGNALASLDQTEGSGRTTPHLRYVPGGAFHVSPSEMRCNSTVSATPGASTRKEALFDNRWSGKNSSTATPWSAVGRRGMVQWAEDQRDSRCSAHPLLRRAAGAPHHGAIAQRLRASGCRLEGCGFESRWSRCFPISLVALRRARGAALTSRRRCESASRSTDTCRRSSADREHLATNEGVGSSNLSDGVKHSVGGSVRGSAQGVVNP